MVLCLVLVLRSSFLSRFTIIMLRKRYVVLCLVLVLRSSFLSRFTIIMLRKRYVVTLLN